MSDTFSFIYYLLRVFIDSIKKSLDFFGGAINLTYASFVELTSGKFYFNLLIEQCYQLGVRSITLTSLTALSTGMVMTLQFGLGLERFGGTLYVPKIVGLSIFRELGPVLTGLMLAARAGAGIASELGSMNATQQIDAIRALGSNPIKLLIIPRVISMIIVTPILTILADLIGIIGGMLIAKVELNIPYEYYMHQGLFVLGFSDFLSGFIKSFVFGFIIAITSCYYGIKTRGGTQGVGQSTTRAVVTSAILVTISDFILTKFIWIFERAFHA